MELREALSQIYEIRQQVARTEVFRGYRAATVAVSGLLALFIAVIQPLLLPQPRQNLVGYFTLWVAAALLSMVVTGLEMFWRCRHSASSLTVVTTTLAVGQFMPAVIAGGLLMVVLVVFAQDNLWMMPGLWSILFSLGIFASFRLLPKATFWVATFYMIAGMMCLALAQGEAAFSPWAMGLPFGVGQLFAAAILYWTLERNDVEV
jgi:hypothetical protein